MPSVTAVTLHHAHVSAGTWSLPAGFDYIIKSASENNIKLIIALGNTWSAYRSPEDMMRMWVAGRRSLSHGSEHMCI